MSPWPPPLSDTQIVMLETIYGLTTTSDSYNWPTAQRVDDYLYRTHDLAEMQATWSSMPAGLIYPPAPPPGSFIPETSLRLSLAGVVLVLAGSTPFKLTTGQLKRNDVDVDEFVASFLEVIRRAATIERGDPDRRLTHRDLPKLNSTLDEFVMLGRVLESEPLGFTEPQRTDPHGLGWSMKPTSAIRPYRNLSTLDEYWTIRTSQNPDLDRKRGKMNDMSAPSGPDAGVPSGDPRKVFLVHGRNAAAESAMREFLYALDLNVIGWTDAANEARVKVNRQPYTLEVVAAGLQAARAVVVLFTPDDLVRLDPRVSRSQETELAGQARPNVVLEAGMILGMAEHKALFVRIGDQRPITDIEGINFVSIDVEDPRRGREDLASRLRQGLKMPVTERYSRWIDTGDFRAAMSYLSESLPFELGSETSEPALLIPESDHRTELAREIKSIVKCAEHQGWQVLNNSRKVLRLQAPRGEVFECQRDAKPSDSRDRLRPFVRNLRAGGLRVTQQVRRPIVRLVDLTASG